MKNCGVVSSIAQLQNLAYVEFNVAYKYKHPEIKLLDGYTNYKQYLITFFMLFYLLKWSKTRWERIKKILI